MNPNLYMNFAVKLFQQNNPILEVLSRVQEFVHLLTNYNSNIKLNKYRHTLYVQQLQRMEGFLTQGNPYHIKGEKIDRRF